MSKKSTIFLHLPAYREPELIPTIKDALEQAKYPKDYISVFVDSMNLQTDSTI